MIFFSTLQVHKKNEGIQDTPFFTLALQALCRRNSPNHRHASKPEQRLNQR